MTTEREQILAMAGEPAGEIKNTFDSDGSPITALDLKAWVTMQPVGTKFYTADQVIAARKDLDQENDQLAKARDYHVLNAKAVYAECSELRQQLAEKDAEIAKATDQKNRMWFELAAAQAQIRQLRTALVEIRAMQPGITPTYRRADNALAQPADTSALEAIVKKAGEVMRERCEACMCDLGVYDSPQAAIRALPGVTMEDLQG